MADIICKACNTPVLEIASFCYHCGLQLKCKSCQEPLVDGANNCVACGTATVAMQRSASSNPFVNTIKLRENKDERVYEIEFTNEVGHEIKEVVADLLKNKMGADAAYINQPLLIRENPSAIPTEEQSATLKAAFYANAESIKPSFEVPQNEPDTGIYPHLDDVAMTLNSKENEWLLIFAFYKSAHGAATFSKEVVWQLYKDKRKTESRFKNLGTNWKTLFKKYICTVKENEFRFTPQGLAKVKSLLADQAGLKNSHSPRNVSSTTPSKTNNVRSRLASRKVVANSIAPDEFDVYQNDRKESLESFIKRKNPGNGNPNRIVAIAYYITHINHQESFTEGNIDYAYRILNIVGKPVHLKQVIINLKNDRIWFKKINDRGVGGWKLTRQAEIYVEEKLPS